MKVSQKFGDLLADARTRNALKGLCEELKQEEFLALAKQQDVKLLRIIQGRISMLDTFLATIEKRSQ